jgi:DNA-binding transcriptional LysR family regulator
MSTSSHASWSTRRTGLPRLLLQASASPISSQVEAYIKEGRLQRVLADFEPPPIPIHILHPAGRYLPSKVRLFIDHLVAELRVKF